MVQHLKKRDLVSVIEWSVVQMISLWYEWQLVSVCYVPCVSVVHELHLCIMCAVCE